MLLLSVLFLHFPGYKLFFYLALFGGGIGLWLGMMVFHHKTRKAAFIAAAALSTILWVSILINLSGAQI